MKNRKKYLKLVAPLILIKGINDVIILVSIYKGEIFMITKFRKEYFFLSNFYPCSVTYKGITYSTSEAAYQAQKTFDESERIRISKLSDPHDAKEEGQKIKCRTGWEAVK